MNRSVLLLLLLTSCTPDYIPDQTVQATREAAEYATRVARVDMAWQFLLCAIFIAGCILFFFLGSVAWFYAQDRSASAELEKAHARKAMLAAIGNGVVLDLETGETYATDTLHAPQITAISKVEYHEEVPEESIERFIIEAARVSEDGWESKTLPRWDKWKEKFPMTAAAWMQKTDELLRRNYIDKSQGRRTMVVYDHNLRWIYDQLTHPTKEE